MPDRRSLSPVRLLAIRTAARAGLLSSAAATAAVAVATVCMVLAWLARAVDGAGDPPPPGLSAEEVAEQVETGAAALSSGAAALVLLVAILAATAIAQLGRLTAAAREHESATARGRGWSRAQAWTADAAEGLVVVSAGAALGLLLTWALAAAVGVTPPDVLGQWPWMLATMAVLVAAFTVALRRGETRRATTRGARATTAALVVIVLLASAFVVWQLPNARTAGFDPVVAIAPAVLLMSAALVALAVFGAAAVAWSRPAAAIPALEPGYPARQVARRMPIYAVAALLIALTVAQAVFSAAYGASWTAMTTDSSAVVTGADLRVDMSPQSASSASVSDAAAVSGVDAVAPALVADVEIGSNNAQLIAVPAPAVETVVTAAGGLVDKRELIPHADPSGDEIVQYDPVALDTATGLRVTADITAALGDPREVFLFALVVDAGGTPTGLGADDVRFVMTGDATATMIAEFELPEGGGPWSLLAIAADAAMGVTIGIAGAEAPGEGDLGVSGDDVAIASGTDAVLWLADGGVLAGAREAGGQVEDAVPPVAATVSAALAARLGVEVGDPLEFRYAGTGRNGEAVISSIVDVVPGASSPDALFVPAETLMTSQLQRGTSIVPPNSVWAAGDPSADDALSAALGDRPVKTSAPGVAQELVGALIPGWWIATAGSAILSLVAAFAIVQTLEIARRRELGVLRALGLTPSRQARMRAAELGGVFAAALVLGAAAGWLVSWLIVPELVRAVTPDILTIAGGVDIAWAPLGIAVVGLAVGLAAIVAVAAAGVRRAARSATVGEEVR